MDIWNRILINLKQKKNLVLLIVVENKGSSPGRQGFKMLVVNDGKRYGSIGGGATEHKMVNRAEKMLAENITKPEIHEQIHRTDDEMHSSGMICSGENKVILYPLYDIHIDNIQEIAGHAILKDEITVKISTAEFRSKAGATIPGQYEFVNNIYKEVIGYKHFVYIIGGGHVGLALSKQMKMLDYYVKIYDNRPELDTLVANKDANEKHIIKYDDIESYIPEGENIYIIIASFSHANDKKILSKLLNKKVAYLGMMGSKNKVKEIYSLLEKEGFKKDDFKHVSAPIGVTIKSETPAEIAVSIAAEIIHIRNTNK
ncbi:MAG: XdhC family protein [Bacteroidales bacterium]|nr:XdhC family protein [Bacteroidales bacterium]